MHVFADVRDINESSAQLLQDVRVDQVLLGVKSGSPRILKKNRKFFTRENILHSVELLCNKGIGIYASFVVGLIGEDESSLQETRSLIDELRKFPLVRCYCNIIMALPGSPLWRSPRRSDWYTQENPFIYDMTEVRQRYLQSQTSLDLPSLEAFRNEVLYENDLKILEYAR